MELPNIYKGNYKMLVIFPIILLAIALYFIPSIKMGVDFQGGTLITLSAKESVGAEDLQAKLRGEGMEATVRVFSTTLGYSIEIEVPQSKSLVRAEELKGQFNTLLPQVSNLEVNTYQNASRSSEYEAKKAGLDAVADSMFALINKSRASMNITGTNDLQKRFADAYSEVYSGYERSISEPINKHVSYESMSVQTVSPVLSARFIDSILKIAVWAAVLSTILVFAFFRSVVPSIAVLAGAACDVVIAMGGMGLFGIEFTLASFAALLMLVGFSLDTDILLTTRMLKRKGDPRENAHDAMKTGLTMSGAAIVAFGALFILSIVTHIPTYYEISAVALCGLFGDTFATWCLNGVLMLHHMEGKRK